MNHMIKTLNLRPIKNFSFLHNFNTKHIQNNIKKNWNTTHPFIHLNPILSILEKCKNMFQLKQIHTQMIITGLILNPLASSRLVSFCAISENGDMNYCKKILKNTQNLNVFSYNVGLRAFSEVNNANEVVGLYENMLGSIGFRPDNYTYPLLLKFCARFSYFSLGKQILVHVLHLGFVSDIYVNNAAIHLFVSGGESEEAEKVFNGSSVRDLVSWNCLINGYVKKGEPNKALKVYKEMEVCGVLPDEVTMIGVISSCAQLERLDFGREFHRYVEKKGLNLTIPLSNVIIDMYVKCGDLESAQVLFDSMEGKTMVTLTTMIGGYCKLGSLEKARRLFDEMDEKDVVPWNAMISGYIQANRYKEALAMFHEMQATVVKPDEITMVSCFSACSQLGALDVGMWMHWYIEKHELRVNVALGTALVDMYAKCGNISKAVEVFNNIPARNSLTYTALIGGLALHGSARDAISYFSEMIERGIAPDEVTFLGLLSACCHGGLVEEGRTFFDQMRSRYNLSPKVKHYSSIVDLLGRAGLLDEAEELILGMPMEADAVVWGSLFFACRMSGNVDMGERVAKKLLELDPHDSGTYVLLASMYGEANRWGEAGRVRRMMRNQGVDKTPGCSSIEVNGSVSEFIVRDKSHPQSEGIYACLDQLKSQLELFECVHGSSFLLGGGKLVSDSELGYNI